MLSYPGPILGPSCVACANLGFHPSHSCAPQASPLCHSHSPRLADPPSVPSVWCSLMPTSTRRQEKGRRNADVRGMRRHNGGFVLIADFYVEPALPRGTCYPRFRLPTPVCSFDQELFWHHRVLTTAPDQCRDHQKRSHRSSMLHCLPRSFFSRRLRKQAPS